MEKMETVKKDIEAAKRLMTYGKEHNGVFEQYDTSFLFGTENQKEINNIINYKGKDVFTVASSGEQYLGSSYYGAKRVDIYDVNRLTKPIAYLRIGSIIALEYDEFIKFSFPYIGNDFNYSFWNVEDILKIINILPEDVAYFWANLLPLLDDRQYGDLIGLGKRICAMEHVLRGMPFYANEEEYYKLKEILKKKGFPKFFELDISSFSDSLDVTYDIIYLSNIIEGLVCYIARNGMYGVPMSENIVEYSELQRILSNLYPLLKKNGIFLVDYRPNCTREASTDYMFNNPYFKVDEIPSKYYIDKKAEKDLVLTYSPKERGLMWKN